MGTFTGFLLTYLFGGITFIPLVIASVFLHAYLTLPIVDEAEASHDEGPDSIVQPGDDTADLNRLRKTQKEQKEENQRIANEHDVAAGYFAVCREYTPMGNNAKPIERSTPVGSTSVAAPSQSVYQSMYRSIFDRKQAPGPLDNKQGAAGSQRPKKAGNMFYVVLRHGHLMLFDDEEQLEVRHVISLAHHDIGIYSGGDKTPEGELFIKRNALSLTRKTDGGELGPDTQLSKPFYLFSDNCPAKEDFYFALLRNQGQALGEHESPKPLQFDVKNIISLVQKLHSSEEHLQTRWLNAFIGRVFLGIYKTKDVENYIREKITKKISRVKRPSFLTRIVLQHLDMGDSAPYFMNPKLKELGVEGECVLETDIKYTGGFRIEVAATIKIDLGQRFKSREVNIVLAVVIRRLEGHLLFKIKPPPSNRIWFSFQTMPKLEMSIEPIVSTRQITYTVILRQIENRIKEVMAETLVNPYWDDVPFFRTEHKKWRGGIFEGDDAVVHTEDIEAIAAALGAADELNRMDDKTVDLDEPTEAIPSKGSAESLPAMEKSHSVPVIESTQPTGFWNRRKNKQQPPTHLNHSATASTSGLEMKSGNSSGTTTPDMPRHIRSSSYSSSSPSLSTDTAHADSFKASGSSIDGSLAASSMASLSSRSQIVSPSLTPVGSPQPSHLKAPSRSSSSEGLSAEEKNESGSGGSGNDYDDENEHETEQENLSEHTPTGHPRRGTESSVDSNHSGENTSPAPSNRSTPRSQTGAPGRGLFARRDTSASVASNGSGTPENKRNTLAAISNATATAKRWGWNAIQQQRERANARKAAGEAAYDINQPMGRGQPLPPPGTPLPGPDRKSMSSVRRKPLATPPQHARQDSSTVDELKLDDAVEKKPPAPPLPRRRRISQNLIDIDDQDQDQVLVVEAPPADSEPDTPLEQSTFERHFDTDDEEPEAVTEPGLDLLDIDEPEKDEDGPTGASTPLATDTPKEGELEIGEVPGLPKRPEPVLIKDEDKVEEQPEEIEVSPAKPETPAVPEIKVESPTKKVPPALPARRNTVKQPAPPRFEAEAPKEVEETIKTPKTPPPLPKRKPLSMKATPPQNGVNSHADETPAPAPVALPETKQIDVSAPPETHHEPEDTGHSAQKEDVIEEGDDDGDEFTHFSSNPGPDVPSLREDKEHHHEEPTHSITYPRIGTEIGHTTS